MNQGKWLLVLGTLSAILLVPDWPHRHLDDPGYWGVIGFLILAALFLSRNDPRWGRGSPNRRLSQLFLLGAPLIYVADWLRFGGSTPEFLIQLAGLAMWIAFAWRSRTSDTALWAACAGHALWDGLHFGRVGFVPEWYAGACLAADLGLGAFILVSLILHRSLARETTNAEDSRTGAT